VKGSHHFLNSIGPYFLYGHNFPLLAPFPSIPTPHIFNGLAIFSLLPYFEKIKGGLWDYLSVCISPHVSAAKWHSKYVPPAMNTRILVMRQHILSFLCIYFWTSMLACKRASVFLFMVFMSFPNKWTSAACCYVCNCYLTDNNSYIMCRDAYNVGVSIP
jgi:hypothetical protein